MAERTASAIQLPVALPMYLADPSWRGGGAWIGLHPSARMLAYSFFLVCVTGSLSNRYDSAVGYIISRILSNLFQGDDGAIFITLSPVYATLYSGHACLECRQIVPPDRHHNHSIHEFKLLIPFDVFIDVGDRSPLLIEGLHRSGLAPQA